MTTVHVIAATLQDPVQAAGILHAIRNAVIIFLLIVFLAGVVVGFLLARLIYRRGGTRGGTTGGGFSSGGGFPSSGYSGTSDLQSGAPPSSRGPRRRDNRPR